MILLNFDDVEHQCEGELVNIDPFQCQKKRNSNVGRWNIHIAIRMLLDETFKINAIRMLVDETIFLSKARNKPIQFRIFFFISNMWIVLGLLWGVS